MNRSRLPATAAFVLGLIAVNGLLGLSSARGDSVNYMITGDTSGLAGTSGYLDFQFNPIAGTNGAAATITGFSTDGTLIGPTVDTGGASGSLPGPVTIADSTGFNDALQQVTYGTRVSFDLSLNFTPDTVNGTTFSFFFLDLNLNGYSTGRSGEAIDITVYTMNNIVIGGPYGPGANSPGFPTTPVLAPVPEPSSAVLMGLGVAAVAVYGRSRAERRAA